MLIFSTICCDASFVMNWAIKPRTFTISSTINQWLQEGRSLIAPSLLFYEMANALHQVGRAGILTFTEAREALEMGQALPIALIVEPKIHNEAMAIADRLKLSATYDAHYLALAERMGAEFWTADRRLYNSVHQHLSWVRFVDPMSQANE